MMIEKLDYLELIRKKCLNNLIPVENISASMNSFVDRLKVGNKVSAEVKILRNIVKRSCSNLSISVYKIAFDYASRSLTGQSDALCCNSFDKTFDSIKRIVKITLDEYLKGNKIKALEQIRDYLDKDLNKRVQNDLISRFCVKIEMEEDIDEDAIYQFFVGELLFYC